MKEEEEREEKHRSMHVEPLNNKKNDVLADVLTTKQQQKHDRNSRSFVPGTVKVDQKRAYIKSLHYNNASLTSENTPINGNKSARRIQNVIN